MLTFGTFNANCFYMKKYAPHLVAVLVFLILTFMYLSPVLQGKTIFGQDTRSYVGMSKEAADYNATHDEQTLWTNSMFGGMPTYQISMDQPSSILKYLDTCLRVLPGPTYRVFLYLIGFYILLLAFGASPYLSMGGAIAFAFGSYNLIIIVAGHNTKAVAIAYMATIIASVYVAFKKNPWLGSAMLALFLGLELYANHVQITYYTLIMIICFGVSELIFAIKEKTLPKFFKNIGILLIGAVLAVGMNATRLITTAEYVKATMRGESNGLTVKGSDSHGLDKDYITQWSYGINESMTLLIPNFMGGASSGTLDENSNTAQTISELTGYKKTGKELTKPERERLDYIIQNNPDNFQARNLTELMYSFNLPLYWGTQPFTAGPVYVGAIICFLFVLGLLIVPARQRWWLFAAAVISLLLSWGKNFMPLTDFFIDYVPMYNKFRTVSMTLTITCLAMCIMAILALKEMLSDNLSKSVKNKSLYIAFGIVGGISLLLWMIPSLAGDFTSPNDQSFTDSYAFLQETLPLDRKEMLSSDAIRSFAFVFAAAVVLWISVKRKINTKWVVLVFAVLFTADMLPIANRYLNDSNFVSTRNLKNENRPSIADSYILNDKTLDYRVLDLTVDIFNSSQPSYFHKTVGGYSAVKLRRYQELIDVQLAPEIMRLQKELSTIRSEQDADSVFVNMNILNMLNTRYLIYHPSALPLLNKSAFGNAWLVDNIKFVDTPDDEISLLDKTNLKQTLLVDKRYASECPKTDFEKGDAFIQLISYSPNELKYAFKSDTPQMAVFSEIFYYKGWQAYNGDKKLPHIRANYLLRAMYLEPGSYDITFKFEPKSYDIGNILALISSILLTLAFAYIIFAKLKEKRSKTLVNQVKNTSSNE